MPDHAPSTPDTELSGDDASMDPGEVNDQSQAGTDVYEKTLDGSLIPFLEAHPEHARGLHKYEEGARISFGLLSRYMNLPGPSEAFSAYQRDARDKLSREKCSVLDVFTAALQNRPESPDEQEDPEDAEGSDSEADPEATRDAAEILARKSGKEDPEYVFVNAKDA